ncbi:MAG: cytochrome c3 family protein [Fidelibacterota bacterium]
MHFKTSFLIILTAGLMLPARDLPQDALLFSHKLHIQDLDLECENCHGTIPASEKVTDLNFPAMETCSECHDSDTAPDDCSLCHTNPDDPGRVERKSIQKLNFSHRFHLEQNAACQDCHTDIIESTITRKSTPISMNLCFNCHTQPTNKQDCYRCHETLAGKIPVSHTPDWRAIHGLRASFSNQNNCFQCHQPSQCEDCHLKRQLENKVHPADFDYTHGQDFLALTSDCATCHAMPAFCNNCHQRQAIMPLNHNSLGWVSINLENGGDHSDTALDNPDYCLLCHETPGSNQTCIRCHN